MKPSDAGWHWNIPKKLTNKEESRLAKKSFGGSQRAAAALCESNIRLALSYAMAVSNGRQNLDDIVSEALFGLWLAATRFNPSLGKFSTYAMWVMRGRVAHHRRQSKKLVRYAPSTARLSKELARMYALTGEGMESEEAVREIARRMDIRPGMVRILWGSAVQKVHMDAPLSDGRCVGDLIASSPPDPEEIYLGSERSTSAKKLIDSMLSVLTHREMAVVKKVAMGGQTFELAGKAFGVTKQRAKQIFDKAIKKMRDHALQCNMLQELELVQERS